MTINCRFLQTLLKRDTGTKHESWLFLLILAMGRDMNITDAGMVDQ
jgi:hypothetical protein